MVRDVVVAGLTFPEGFDPADRWPCVTMRIPLAYVDIVQTGRERTERESVRAHNDAALAGIGSSVKAPPARPTDPPGAFIKNWADPVVGPQRFQAAKVRA